MIKYFLTSFDKNDREILGSTGKSFGKYANDKRAVRYMYNTAMHILESNNHIETVRIFRYTNIYDDSTMILIAKYTNKG